MSVGDVRPGLLVSHRYVHEIAMVLTADLFNDRVRVVNLDGATVQWSYDSFRSVYEAVQNHACDDKVIS